MDGFILIICSGYKASCISVLHILLYLVCVRWWCVPLWAECRIALQHYRGQMLLSCPNTFLHTNPPLQQRRSCSCGRKWSVLLFRDIVKASQKRAWANFYFLAGIFGQKRSKLWRQVHILGSKAICGTLTCRIQAQGGITAKDGKKWKTQGWIVAKAGQKWKPRAE